MYFGTEAGLLKAVCSQEVSAEFKEAARGIVGLWGAKTGRAETIQGLRSVMQESFSRKVW